MTEESTAGRKRLIYLVPLILAVVSIYQGPLSWMLHDRGNDVPGENDVLLSFLIGVAWLASIAVAMYVTKQRRALHLLMLAPIVLYWQAMWAMSLTSVMIDYFLR